MFWTPKPDELNPSLYVITATSDLLRNGLLEKKKKKKNTGIYPKTYTCLRAIVGKEAA